MLPKLELEPLPGVTACPACGHVTRPHRPGYGICMECGHLVECTTQLQFRSLTAVEAEEFRAGQYWEELQRKLDGHIRNRLWG